MNTEYINGILRYLMIETLMMEIHTTAIDKGWWADARNRGEMIALMHSELSEALEGLRHGDPPSEHIPEFSAVEEEMADLVIRVFDFCLGCRYDLPGALLAKMEFNKSRPQKHGKEF